MNITAVTTQKNEGAFLLEWIAYHKIIGFTDIVILSNDCEDGSDEMLDHLSKSGEIIHLRNDGPYDDRGIQFAALTSDKPSREFYKLQRARRDMLRHLRRILGQALARPGPLLTKLVCQHTLRLHPTAPQICCSTAAGGTNGGRIIPSNWTRNLRVFCVTAGA